jgi:hypothetical protein
MMSVATAGSVNLRIIPAVGAEAERLVARAIQELEAPYAGLKGNLDRSPEFREHIMSRLPTDFSSAMSRSLASPNNLRELEKLGITREHFLDIARANEPLTSPRFDIDKQKILWGSGIAAGTAAGFVCGRYVCIDKDPTARALEWISTVPIGAPLPAKP